MPSDTAHTDAAAGEPTPVSGVADRYASALFDLAREQGDWESVEKELKSLRAAIHDSEDLRAFVKSPVYDRDDQLAAVAAIAEKAGFSATTTNFLKVVASNRRLFVIEGMIAAYIARAARERGEVMAQAIAAAPMSDDQVKALRLEIESSLGKAVNLQTRVEPDLLGGLIVKIGSTMIDSSLRTKLNKLKTAMKEA
ncbi:MAG: F0F1 ATP synthase subunit delta [Pseudomonadota bacterium]